MIRAVITIKKQMPVIVKHVLYNGRYAPILLTDEHQAAAAAPCRFGYEITKQIDDSNRMCAITEADCWQYSVVGHSNANSTRLRRTRI